MYLMSSSLWCILILWGAGYHQYTDLIEIRIIYGWRGGRCRGSRQPSCGFLKENVVFFMTIKKLTEKERKDHWHSRKHSTDFNNLVKFCDNSGLIFLRSTTRVLSEPILFIGPRYLINLETWRPVKKNISKFVLPEREGNQEGNYLCSL